MRFKVGVKLHKLQPQTLLAMGVVEQVYQELFGREPVLTSVNDGEHMVGSKHYKGEAFDVRVNDLTPVSQRALHTTVKNRLGVLGYDVLLEEYPGRPARNHLHVEWDPKD